MVASLLIVAVAGVSELHCTVPVIFCVLPSVYVPVAVNCCVIPRARVGIAGVTAIETRTAGVTVRVVEPAIAPDVALTLVLPTATLVATPVLLRVTMLLSPVLQTADLVRSRVLPSLYVPVAIKDRFVPRANDVLTGVSAIDTSTAC